MIKIIKKSILFIVPIFMFTGCSGASRKQSKEINFNKASIAVIESSTFNRLSYLKLYDLKGKLIEEDNVDCTDVNSGFLSPVTYSDKVYTNSIGGYSDRSKKVVKFDLKNNNYETFDIDYGIFTLAINGKYIFTSSSPLRGSIIKKYNIDGKRVEKTLNVPGLIQHLTFNKNLLCAFSDSDDKDGTIIITLINPDTLKIENSIKIKSDQSVFDSVNVGNYIYFTHSNSSDGKSPSRIMSRLNVKDGTVSDIVLQEGYPDHIKKYNNKLLITHYNPVLNTGDKLTEFNLATNEQKIISLDHNVSQIEIKDKKLIATDNINIYIYDINSFKLLYKFKVMDNRKDYRINGFFIIS